MTTCKLARKSDYFLSLSHMEVILYLDRKKALKSVPSYSFFQHLLKTFQNVSLKYNHSMSLQRALYLTNRQGLIN